MSILRRKNYLPFTISLAILLLGGCDRIPFLSQFFSSESSKSESAPATSQPQVSGTVLARVDNWTLTLDDFNQKAEALRKLSSDIKIETFDDKKNLLEELIRQQLLVKEAKARGLERRKEIRDAVVEFERGLLVRALLEDLTQDIKVDSKEVEDYYNENRDKDPFIREATQWHIREIVVATQQQANDILIELLKGADFASMARGYSKADNAKNGGDLGFVSQEKLLQLAPSLQIAVLSLEVGGLSNVVKGPDGFYILKLEEKSGGKEKSLSQSWDYIRNGLISLKQNEKLQNYLNTLRQNSKIEIHEDLLR